jgi:deazaflavin-dependent oxidoreductase (nitroreductase family)
MSNDQSTDIEERATDGTETGATHSRQYLESDGAAVEHPAVGKLILLYTRGRVSGEMRRTPLRFFEVGGDLVVAASARGSDHQPDWYLNLIAEPEVWVRRDAQLYQASASPIEGAERDLLWSTVVVALAPNFAQYQAATDRVIPLVRLIR